MSSDYRITEIRVRGMRVLDEVRLRFPEGKPLVVIGDNGSGKSSLIEACELLCRAADESFSNDLLQIHGGPRALLRRGAQEVILGFSAEGPDSLDYEMRIANDRHATVADRLLVRSGDGAPLEVLRKVSNDVSFFDAREGKSQSTKIAFALPAISAFGVTPPHPAIGEARELLRRLEVHTPFETTPAWLLLADGFVSPMRSSRVVEPTSRLARRGHNLANAFFALRNDASDEHWQETMRYVRLGLGADVESINTRADPGGGAIALQLKYVGIDEQVSAFSLSDGMLAYLAFVAMFRLPSEASLLAFDEPETHLHPDLLMRVLGFFEILARDRPVLIATHSDRLLDGLADPAASAALLELDEQKRTRVVRPDPEALAKWLERYRGLGQIRAESGAPFVFAKEEKP